MQITEVIPPIIRNMYHDVAQSDIYFERSPSPNLDIKVVSTSVIFGKQYLLRSSKDELFGKYYIKLSCREELDKM